jgi:GNAT superfamily N-acetyltransferase
MSVPVTITAERPDAADAIELIAALESELTPLYPRESRHGLSVEQLIEQRVAFFLLRAEGVAAACGGVKFLGAEYGEIKRMYVRPEQRGRGYARRMLDHLAEYARSRSVFVLRLETGIHQRDAIALYERWGFTRIPPFGDYRDDPLSIYFERWL